MSCSSVSEGPSSESEVQSVSEPDSESVLESESESDSESVSELPNPDQRDQNSPHATAHGDPDPGWGGSPP